MYNSHFKSLINGGILSVLKKNDSCFIIWHISPILNMGHIAMFFAQEFGTKLDTTLSINGNQTMHSLRSSTNVLNKKNLVFLQKKLYGEIIKCTLLFCQNDDNFKLICFELLKYNYKQHFHNLLLS